MLASKRHLAGLALGLAAAAASFGACAGLPLNAYADASDAWRRGDRDRALGLAQTVYERFRDENHVPEATIRDAVAGAYVRLEEEIVVPRADRPPRDIEGHDPWSLQPDEIAAEIRADLLSGRATRVMRAVQSVEALRLRRHAQGLLAVIFARRALEDDGGVLTETTPALRSLAAKRAALDALARL